MKAISRNRWMVWNLFAIYLFASLHFSLYGFSKNSIDKSSATCDRRIIPDTSNIICNNKFHSFKDIFCPMLWKLWFILRSFPTFWDNFLAFSYISNKFVTFYHIQKYAWTRPSWFPQIIVKSQDSECFQLFNQNKLPEKTLFIFLPLLRRQKPEKTKRRAL